MTIQETIKKLRRTTGLSQRKFAKKYEIPYRTIENWEEGKTEPPDYVLELLRRCVQYDEHKEWHEWQDVKNKKPDSGIDILFCDSDGDMFTGHYSEMDDVWLSDDAGSVEDVVAWMYVPEAYRRDE